MSDFKWCHGTAGILFGWKLSLRYFRGAKKVAVEREIQRLMSDHPNVLCREEVGLCHGNLGNVLIGNLAGIDLWKDSLQKNALKSIQVLQEIFLKKDTMTVLHEQYDYSLMTGLSGVGYGLLYSLSLDLPGILNLQL